ncbi:MAG: hypothetical protein M1821_003746 [Bathelium mastoideum]|nr:MAG: hypothetical protein M1821_003746 [Bathelium mastoideum]
MRYYVEGDLIYIFGFSRGAYTARFLAEMLCSIGLLSRGNEEMVRFAWNTFSDFQRSRGNVPQSKKDKENVEFMRKFKHTFCRNIGVYFLGLFDCVNSVGQFEIPMSTKSYSYIAMPPARYIRHAISIHERRLKFKPALFLMDDEQVVAETHDSDVQEVWFAGNHGDVGGGWGLSKNQRHLLSDTPLEWMLQELKKLPEESQLAFSGPLSVQDEAPSTQYDTWLFGLLRRKHPSNHEARVSTNQPHDMLAFGHGASWFATLQWWILVLPKEILPFFTRLELESGKWVPRYWPPNLGTPRDIPSHSVIHPTVDAMYRAGVLSLDQMPKLGGSDGPKLPRPLAALSTWARMRTIREEEAEEQKRNQDNPDNGANGSAGQPDARRWDNLGYVTARSWNWD